MCDPVSLGIMAGTKAASGVFQQQAARKVKKARERAIAGTLADINALRDQSRTEYAKAADASSPDAIRQKMNENTLARTADYEAAIREPQNVVSAGASDAAKRAISNILARGLEASRDEAAKRAAAESYGSAAFGRNIALGRANAAIKQNADFAAGRERVGELQLEDANRAGRKDAAIAGIIDALGTVAGAAAGPALGTAPGYDFMTGVRWNTARQLPNVARIVANPSYFGPFQAGVYY